MELKILPPGIANMIAAGEVVQRPASVVKELMENAVDAGADEITVAVKDAGRTLIRVIDNGCGMSPDDAVLCFERHATSKIATAEDLGKIVSFGFRGEALASIAAVAEVSLRTRREEDELGCEVEFAGGEHLATRETAAPKGSMFSVRNLFFNVPARRKFLKSDTVEFRHIVEEFTRVALTRPETAFTLIHNEREVFVLKKAKSLKFRILNLLGTNIAEEVADLESDTSIVRISGYVGRPDSARKTLGNQFLFINGRYFRSPYLHKAVMKAYEGLIPEGATPSYFIYLETDPSAVDVNIHPTKTEVKFEDDSVIFQILSAAVRKAVGVNTFAGDIDFDSPRSEVVPVVGRSTTELKGLTSFTPEFDAGYNPFQAGDSPASEQAGFRAGSQGGFYGRGGSLPKDFSPLLMETPARPEGLLVYQGRYIFAPSEKGMMVVSVRRARERILYDRFITAIAKRGTVTQSALFPVSIQTGVATRALFDENARLLSSLGFDIAPFGTDTVVVNGVPEGFSCESGKVRTMIDDLSVILSEDRLSLKDAMESALAEKFAILGASTGDSSLSPTQARILLDSLLSSSNPEFTSGGRRIISVISPDEIDKRF